MTNENLENTHANQPGIISAPNWSIDCLIYLDLPWWMHADMIMIVVIRLEKCASRNVTTRPQD
jgi:hypothetical protein